MTTDLEKLVELIRAVPDRKINSRSDVVGNIILNTDIIDLINYFGSDIQVDISSDGRNLNDQIADYTEQSVEISITHSHSSFYNKINDLINVKTIYDDLPSEYYVFDIDYYSKENKSNQDIVKLTNYKKFIKFLHDVADAINDSKLIFISKGEKLEINVNFEATQMHELAGIEDFLSNFNQNSDSDYAQKTLLFKTTIIDFSKSAELKNKFEYLCKNFSALCERFKDNYHIYIEGIDIHRIINEVNTKKLEYLRSVNNVFLDIQGKMLTIPSLLLVFFVKKLDIQQSDLIFVSISVIVGVFIYLFFMFLMVDNQIKFLREISDDVDGYKKEILNKTDQTMADKIDKKLVDVENRAKSIRRIFIFLKLFIVVLFVVMVPLYYYVVAKPILLESLTTCLTY